MARLREKISELKTKYGITEEAAREVLAHYDNDLAEANALLAEEQNKVVDWNKFWFEQSPKVEALAREYEAVKAQLDAIKAATDPTYRQTVTPPTPTPQTTQTPVNSEELEQRVYRNFSQVQEDLWNIQRQHFENYKTIPDLAPIKKLIEEKKLTPWKAYEEWVAPMEAERKEKILRDKITTELTEKFQNEATRTGINSYMLSNRSATTGEEVTSPIDEALRDRNEAAAAAAAVPKPSSGERTEPSEFELLTDFVQSMRQGRSGVAH